MKKKIPVATEGFLKRQRRPLRKPEARIKQRVGELYKTPSGVIYEVVELYGGMVMMKIGINMREALDRMTVDDLKNPESPYSYLWTHDFKKYTKIKEWEIYEEL